ncbi:hypothetical protein B0O99DRAFT_595045 [Bisporella sp. PMI_857]|nr:hypothetical protein B0O99DRAFT_595045 [Bisporella sp. PMI_857]
MTTASQPASHADAPEPAASLAIRERTQEDLKKIQLERYVSRDLLHSAAIVQDGIHRKDVYTRMRDETEDYKKIKHDYRASFPASRLYGTGYNGYGNGITDAPQPRLVYPHQKPKLGNKKGLRKAAKLHIKRKDMKKQAEMYEELVPIRIDVDWDKIKLQDTFTWNLSDRTIPRDLFAQQLVEDFGLSLPAAAPVYEQIQRQLDEQLNDFYPQVFIEEDALDPELPYSAYKNDEMRILIKLDITIGTVKLHDRFEWEINNDLNSPEEFARNMAWEMGLSGEFTTAIAHCIREQSQLFTRGLFLTGHPFDGRPLDDADLVAAFLPSPIPSVFRPYQQAKEYMPYMYEVTEADLEKDEIIYSREQRRQKRSVNRRGGPALPELKDRQRTVRTRMVNSVIPNCVEKVERPTDNPVYKRVVVKKKGLRDGDLSESSESEDSAPESPAITLTQGTARTRNMRGAATAAQQRMANLGRSETPEVIPQHHHETRTSLRRTGRDAREESPENTALIIKLKVGKDKLKKWIRDGMKSARPTSQQTPSHTRPQSSYGTPAAAGSMGPPSTPGLQNQKLATATTPGAAPAQIGRVEAPPPVAGVTPTPPKPPTWLEQGLQDLRGQYPSDRFEGVMRYSAVNTTTDAPCPAPAAGQPIPDDIKFMYLPRIRCHDCPGKLYTPGPEMTVVNFEVHLKNRQHRERVEQRIAGGDRWHLR